MVREVRSPWNTTGNEPMRGYSPRQPVKPVQRRTKPTRASCWAYRQISIPASLSAARQPQHAQCMARRTGTRPTRAPMSEARHHRASRDGPIVVLVPVPVGGSPQPLKWAKPPQLSTAAAPAVADPAIHPIEPQG